MSVQSQIDRITQNVADTYSALIEKGATPPAEQTSDNLAETARSVSTGVELPELTSPGDADKLFAGYELIDGAGAVVEGAFTIDPELSEQDDLIEQIKTALQGKAAMGSELPTQEKTVEIIENGTHEIAPDEGYTLSKVTVTVNVEISGEDGVRAMLENTVTEINSDATNVVAYACRAHSKIVSVNLPEATSIGTYAFHSCNNMTSFNAPKVTSLGTYSLYSCSKLTVIDFPIATSVPSNLCYQCTRLVKADFGTAGSIATYAFYGCSSLTALILRKSDTIVTLSKTDAFTSSAIKNGTGYVYVPAALIEHYKAATNWSTYADKFRAIEDYPDICG